MDDPYSTFAASVHEVVDLSERGVALQDVEAHIESMTLDLEQRSALWLLAWSMHDATSARRTGDVPAEAASYA